MFSPRPSVLPCAFASKILGAKAAEDDPIPMFQPETGIASGPGSGFRQFASIGDEIDDATCCINEPRKDLTRMALRKCREKT